MSAGQGGSFVVLCLGQKGVTMRSTTVMPSDNEWRILRVILVRAHDLGGRSGCPQASDTGEMMFKMSLSEIARAAGVRPGEAYKSVRRLTRRGIIRRESRRGPTPATIYMAPHVFSILDSAICVLTAWGERLPPEWGEWPSAGRSDFGGGSR